MLSQRLHKKDMFIAEKGGLVFIPDLLGFCFLDKVQDKNAKTEAEGCPHFSLGHPPSLISLLSTQHVPRVSGLTPSPSPPHTHSFSLGIPG